MPFSGVLTATVLVCCTMTLLMGLYARLPFGVAPGMGLNAFFTYTIILQGGVPVAGRARASCSGPACCSCWSRRRRCASTSRWRFPSRCGWPPPAGIGLLLTFIGLQNAGFVADNPATLVGVGAARSSRAR